jgi:AmmeMemoRadiSam system protein B
MLRPAGKGRPTEQEIRKEMGIPSAGDLRGQLDTVGYASKPEQMAKVWELGALPPAPPSLGTDPKPGVIGVVAPHDDYIYAGRVDRRVLPLVTAKTVVMIGVFHAYRRFGAHDEMVFEDYRAWRAPDGEMKISPLRDEIFAALPKDEAVRDDLAHDAEHSLESLAYWLRHSRPDVELVPMILPVAPFPRFEKMAQHFSAALAQAIKKRGWVLGRDIAVVISSDGTHYGPDFKYVPFGEGGVTAFEKSIALDRGLLNGVLSGAVSTAKAREFFASAVNPDKLDDYRSSWCGRFSLPFGLMVLANTAHALGQPAPVGVPLALSATVDAPELKVRDLGLGPTAPANLYHFVMHPAVAFVPGKP